MTTPTRPPARRKGHGSRQRARRPPTKITMITAYDATLARLLDTGGVDMLLVGDSLAWSSRAKHDAPGDSRRFATTGASSAGRGGGARVGDLPFGSYQVSPRRPSRARCG